VPTPLDFARDERSQQNLRTKGGEPTIVRLANGRLQLRLAPPGRMTDAAEKTYLLALSASANIRLAAKAAGFAHSSFYRRALRHPAFAAQGKVALTIGYDRLEHLALAHAGAAMRGEGPDNAWQVAAGEMPMPPMSWDQAFHTLCQHRAIVRLGWEERTRPIAAPADPAQAFAALERTLDADARVRHYEATGRWHLPGEPELPRLPPLGLVTGWSGAATVKVTHNPGVPLFGGWRIDDWKKRKKAG
jgi:hypothetical protein